MLLVLAFPFRCLAYHSGRIFVGDTGKSRVFVLDSTQDVETFGEPGNGKAQFMVSVQKHVSLPNLLIITGA